MRTSLGDRRAGLRFQVAGRLWASLDVRGRVTLRNIGSGGALLEVQANEELRTARVASLTLGDGGAPLTVHVRRIFPLGDAADDRCLVAVEFVDLTRGDRQLLDAFIRRQK